MKTRIIVAGIIHNKDKVLLGKKDKGRPPYPNVWHTIGGGINDFEKGIKLIEEQDYDNPYFHEELIRELDEEAPNLKIDIEKIKCIIPEFRQTYREDTTIGKDGNPLHMIFLEYFCEYKDGDTTAADDIVKLKWFKKEDLKNTKLTLPSQEMYKELKWL